MIEIQIKEEKYDIPTGVDYIILSKSILKLLKKKKKKKL